MGPIPVPDSVSKSDPDDTYNYAWVVSLLEEVLRSVEGACRQENLATHWQIFSDRVIRPILEGTSPPSLTSVSEKYGISDVDRASNMIITVKRRFQKALRARVRGTVVRDDQVEDELGHIIDFLQGAAQDIRDSQ